MQNNTAGKEVIKRDSGYINFNIGRLISISKNQTEYLGVDAPTLSANPSVRLSHCFFAGKLRHRCGDLHVLFVLESPCFNPMPGSHAFPISYDFMSITSLTHLLGHAEFELSMINKRAVSLTIFSDECLLFVLQSDVSAFHLRVSESFIRCCATNALVVSLVLVLGTRI